MALFDKMQQAKKLYKLQKTARGIQKELKNTEIQAESWDDNIKVIVSADQKLQGITINPDILSSENAKKIEKALQDAFNEAMKEAQRISVSKMKEISGDLGLPGF